MTEIALVISFILGHFSLMYFFEFKDIYTGIGLLIGAIPWFITAVKNT